jgi:hypothetical protein
MQISFMHRRFYAFFYLHRRYIMHIMEAVTFTSAALRKRTRTRSKCCKNPALLLPRWLIRRVTSAARHPSCAPATLKTHLHGAGIDQRPFNKAIPIKEITGM